MRYTVTLPHKGEEPKYWAREHCLSYASCTLHGNFSDGRDSKPDLFMDYHFSDEKDAFWFRMRWE